MAETDDAAVIVRFLEGAAAAAPRDIRDLLERTPGLASRRLRRRRLGLVAVAAVVVLVGAVIAVVGVRASRPAPPPATVLAPPPSALVYDVPGPTSREPGTLMLREADGRTRRLGETDTASVVAETPAGSVLAYDPRGGRTSVVVPDASQGRTTVEVGGVRPTAVGVVGQAVVVQRGDELVAVGPTETRRVASLPDVTPTSDFPPGYKGMSCGCGAGQVAAIVRSDGGLLVVSSTGRGTQVTNVTTGASASVGDYGYASTALLGADGQLYVLATHGGLTGDPTLDLVRLDPSTLGVTRTWPLGIRRDDLLEARLLDVPDTGVVLATSHATINVGRGGRGPVDLDVRVVTGDDLGAPVRVPSGTGLHATVAGSGSLFVFGGPSVNRVSQLDLATGAVTPRPDLDSPRGTYLVALLH